jgi:hypothetical protein
MLEFLVYLVSGVGYGLYFDLNLLECAVVALVLLCVFRGWTPGLSLSNAWRAWMRLARRRKTAVAAVFVLALASRAAVLPWLPVPHPVVADEFSHLLLADTLAHGHLTNPTHPMWKHFESIHIIQKPTYNSDYFPGQGAVLALGKLAGHPWMAVWILSAAMCAALCWMLQVWVSPSWALFGGVLAVLRFGIAGYWINGYYGGSLAALGGALALGAYPRLLKKPSLVTSLLLGLGVVVIGYTRAFEGLAVAVPVLAGVGFAVVRKRAPLWTSVPGVAVILAGVAGLLVYCRAVTGDPLRTPYAVNQATYGWPMTLPWYHPPEVALRHVELRRYYDYEREVHDRSASWAGAIQLSTLKAQEIWRFYFGPALSIPLVMLPRVWRSRRLRLLLVCGGLTVLASLIEVGSSPHYAAAATGCFLGVQVECFRRLRVYRRGRRPIGLQLVVAAPAIVILILAARIGLEQLGLPYTQAVNFQSWCCVPRGNPNKARILDMLLASGGRHLVIVRPKTDPNNLFQWIYNASDIDVSPVVWARDLGARENQGLLDYFHDRKVWLLDPNVEPARILPYTDAVR